MRGVRACGGKAVVALVAILALAAPVRGDICLSGLWDDGSVLPQVLFPNWGRVRTGSFTAMLCDSCLWQAVEHLTGITVCNFGTATAADIKAVYVKAECGATNTGLLTLTYGGMFVEDSGTYPGWTWAGVSADMGSCPAGFGGAPAEFTMSIYVDMDPCPTAGRTVRTGFPTHLFATGINDDAGCGMPYGDETGPVNQIAWVMKQASVETAAPGDIVTFTVRYGKPGNVALGNIVIMDSLPPYTHYVTGSGVPAPDIGWDPNFGPPAALRWTITPVTGNPPAWGPTSEVVFAVTVDWGNGESFEPGSGDLAAPEGARLDNVAQVFFNTASCAQKSAQNPPVTAVVRRFLFWKIADNDVLFSPSYGQSPDEITYSLFLKNMSPTKTWWDVQVWDTVPPEIEAWPPGYGFDDPCGGWTMTPSGCAAASPGPLVGGGNTMLTWNLDMPPGLTVELRWKGRVRATTTAGAIALNRAAVMELGRTGIVGGTGHSQVPRIFLHSAAIILPTTYTSYIGVAAADSNFWACCNTGVLATQGYWLGFFPLNMKCNFNLYEQNHLADAWTAGGGSSPPIAAFAGACTGGGASWISGCGIERAPAFYIPVAYNTCATLPVVFHNIYKLVSNAPLLWEFATNPAGNNMDNLTYVGTTSLSYAGYTSYTYSRVCSYPQYTDGLYLVNTSTQTPTAAFIFQWDPATLTWGLLDAAEINTNSQWFFDPPIAESYKVISSAAPLVILKGYPGMGAGGAFNDSGTQAPNAENGHLVSSTAPATFYPYCGGPDTDGASLAVGNVGVVGATYEVWEYFADNPLAPNISTTHLTNQVVGSSGSWTLLRVDNVASGLAAAGNPHVYGQNFDPLIVDTFTLYKVKLVSGGPIQVYNGRDIYSPYGSGSVIHSTTPPGGNQFWFQMVAGGDKADCGGVYNQIMTMDFYCPKSQTVVTAVSNAGSIATYTTPGPDCCVSFMGLTKPGNGVLRNYKITSVGGIIAAAHQIHCQEVEKIYTAPFLAQGVHYTIIAPPVAFVGQTFWITVLVVDGNAQTQTDYCGTTSFTSTDPTAKIAATAMDTYNYTWKSDINGSSCDCGIGCGDNGVKIFFAVTLGRLGVQTIVAADTADGSIAGLTAIMVVGVDVKLFKQPLLAIGASGDTVRFRVCWSNYSSASAFTFVITDAIPQGTTFVPEAGTAAFDCGNSAGVAPATAYSTAASATPPAAFTTGNPTAGTFWLRWTIPSAGVNTTGCVCYRVSVN